MIHNLKPYPVYKDSGVPWLGEVPEHWEFDRAKWLFQKMNRSVQPDDDVVTCFRDGVVTLRKNRRISGFTESLKEIGYQGVRRGDLVIHAMDAFAGAIGVSDSDGKCTPVYAVCQPIGDINPHYYSYIIREMARSQWIAALAKGIRERSTDFRFDGFASQSVPIPPKQEQDHIAVFIDYIDRRIWRYIRAKQKLIKLLEEQKQAIIHQAVTRGLDPNVKLKPSEVEWLGDVPENWEVRKLKYEVTFTGGGTPSKANVEFWIGNIPWVSPKDMRTSIIKDTEDHISDLAVIESATNLINPGNVLLVVRSGILRRKIPVAINNVPVALNQDMKALGSKGRLHNEYIFALIEGCQKILLTEWTKQGATVESIEYELMANSFIPVPPKNEQLAIVHYLSEADKNVDSTITKTRQEISLLREYRTRLIADVVTGKLDVREAAANLSEKSDEIVVDDDFEEEINEENLEEVIIEGMVEGEV